MMLSTPSIWGKSAKTTCIAAAAGAAWAGWAGFCKAVTCCWSVVIRALSSWIVGAWFAIALDWLLAVATTFDDFQLLGISFSNKSCRWRYSWVIRSKICWLGTLEDSTAAADP